MLHIFMNLGALAYIGAIILEKYGSRRFWLITFFTGIGGGLLSAIGTLMTGGGLLVFLEPFLVSWASATSISGSTASLFFRDMFKNFLIWGNGICILLTLTGIMRIDNLGHIGGMLSGMLLGIIFEKRLAWWKPVHEHLLMVACLLLWGYGLYRVYTYTDYFFIKGNLY